MLIKIEIKDKRAQVLGSPVLVCGNTDNVIEFTFDEEWDASQTRTARFVYIQDGEVKHTDVVFTGHQAAVPLLSNTREVNVGVFSGELMTTTPARIPCERSILCGTGTPEEPTPSQYDQIIALLNSKAVLDAIRFSLQELGEQQKNIARSNIGAASQETNQQQHEELMELIEGHTENKKNPHGVTYDQVGAAPAGYGLGEGGKAFFPTSEAELNNILDEIISTMPDGATGFYRIYDNEANIWGGSCMFVTLSKLDDTYATADFRSYAYTTSRLFKTRDEAGWHSLEWLNPLMEVGKEYKTVEKWQRESGGKIYSVYKRSVVFGALPNTYHKTEQVDIGSDFEIIDYKGIIAKKSSNTFVSLSATNLIDSTWISKNNTTAIVGVNTVSDATEYSMIVELKYVKL